MVFNVAWKSFDEQKPNYYRIVQAPWKEKIIIMAKIAVAVFLFSFAVNMAYTLITPEEAKNLALLQSDIFSSNESYDSNIDEHSLEKFMDMYKNSAHSAHIGRVQHKVNKIVSSFQFIKTYYQKFKTFADALKDLQNYLEVDELYDDAMQIYSVANNEKKGHVDVLDVMAHNQDSETKCATNASSVYLIRKLYESVAYAQVEVLTVQLYAHKLLQQLNGDSHQKEMNKLVAQFTDKMTVTFSNFNKAIETASEETKKCNNQTSQ